MQTVEHHGRRTVYRHSDRGGTDTPLCLIHGSGGESGVWRSQFRLSDRHPIVAPTLSGHGEGDARSEDVSATPGYETLSAYTDDVLAAVESAGYDPASTVFVGNSMGGAVGLHLSLERGLSPAGLVLANSGARLPVLDDLRSWLRRAVETGDAGSFDRAVDFLHEPGRLFIDADDDLRTASAATMRAAGPAVVYRDFETSHDFDVREHLSAVETTTLVVAGEHDHLTPRRFQAELVDGLPDAELAVLEGTGHLSMVERPEAFNAALLDFLERRV